MELTLEGRSRVQVRSIREGEAGRFRFLPLVEAPAAGADPAVAREGGSGTDRKPPAAAAAGAAASAGAGILVEFEKEGGIIYLGLGGPVGTPDPPVRVELEVPAKLAMALLVGTSDVSVRGEPVDIPDTLEPYVPPQPRQPPGMSGMNRPISSPAVAPPEGAPAGPARVQGGIGGSITVHGEEGSVRMEDLLQNVSIEWNHGTVALARLAGSVKIAGPVTVETAAVGGTMFIQGATGVRAKALRSTTEIKGGTGRIEVRGIIGDLRLTLKDAQAEIEDVRGRFDANATESELTVSSVTALTSLTLAGGNVTAERLQLGVQGTGSWRSMRLREVTGPVNLKGDGESAEVESSVGPVSVRGDVRDVRVRDIQTDVVLQLRGGDAMIDRVGGRVTVNAEGGRTAVRDVGKQVQVTADWVEATISGVMEAAAEYSFRGQKSVHVDLPDGRYDIRVRADGEIESDFPFEKATAAVVVQQAVANAGQLPGQQVQQPGTGGIGIPPRPIPPKPIPPRAGQRITIDCSGDVEIRKH